MIEEVISQEPVQEPPYKKKVFDILSSNFDDFKLGEQDFYKKLATDKTYASKVHDVLIENFSDFKKPKNEFIDSLTFEEPLKKKDGGGISSPTKLQFPSLDTKLFGEAAIKPVSESTNFGNADIVDKTKMMESLPFVKDKAIHDKTIKNLLQQGKLAMEGSNSYKEEKQNVANTLSDEEWMPAAIKPVEKDYIKNKAIKDFSAYNKEDAGVIQQKLDNGDYLLENGKIKIRGGIADNFGQGVKDFIDNVGLSLNVAAAQSRGNNNEVKYYMNEFFKDKEKDKEFAAVSLPEKASKVIGEMSPYAIAGAVMPYADIPLMGMSNLASNHQAIWDDPKLTMDEKVNAIYNTSQDAFMTGNLQGAAFHSLGITDEKVAKELLSKYQPTQKLYNTFKDVIKTLPSDVSKVAAIGGGTEVLNNLTKNKAGIKVDFSTVPEGALSLATLELIMKAPKVFVSGFKTINEAVRTGYDKENPNWYNGYSKNVQDVLNQIVASPEPVYKKLINLLDIHPDAESNLAKQKIETFRDYYKSLPADLDQAQKNKALHILQLKTEAIADSKNAQDPTIRKALENKSNAYDKILQKVIDKESVKEGEEPLLSSRFAKPTLQEEEPAIKVEPIEEVNIELKGENAEGRSYDSEVFEKDDVKYTKYTGYKEKNGKIVRTAGGGREMTWDEFTSEYKPDEATIESIGNKKPNVTITEIREGKDGRNVMSVTFDYGKDESGIYNRQKNEIAFERAEPTKEKVKPIEVKEIGADIINNTKSKILLPVEELNKLRTQKETDLATGNAIDLEKDLLKNGIKEPLVITYYPEEGKARLTDGHNRLDVAKDMGAENLPIRIVYDYGEAPSSAKDFILPTEEVKPTEIENKKERYNTNNEKFVKYNPNDVLPLLEDYKPTNKMAVEDYVIQTIPNDASVEAYKKIPIDAIKTSEKIDSKDRKKIDKIKEGIKNGDDIPPIVVDFAPVIKNGEPYQFGLMDGHHRYIAYKELGIKEIPAAIVTSREHYEYETNDSNISTLFKPAKEVKSTKTKEKIAEPSFETDIKKQIEDFGVPKEDVEPVNTMLSNIHESLKKAGLTATNTLSEWVGIGKGTKDKGALYQATVYGNSGIVKRPSFDKTSADAAIKSGRVKVISPKESLQDLIFAITHWDDLFVGDIYHDGKKIGSFDGGVFYPLNGGEKGKMGASVNPQSAGAFSTQSNRSLFKNNGIKLPESFDEGTFVVEKGTNKNEWLVTNKAGEKVTVTLPDNPKPGVIVIGKGDNLKHKSSLSAKVGFVNTLLSYAKGKEGYDGLINAIKSVYSIGNTRNADGVIELFNNYLKSGRMADGQTMSEAKTSYENFRAALIKDANQIVTSMMRDMGYTDAEYFDGTQLKKGIYKATGKGIDKMFADIGQEDFLKGLKTGDAYAALKVTSPVFFEKDLGHPSYPFAIKTVDGSPVNIDIFDKTFRTFGENQGIEGRLPKEGQTATEGFGVTTTTKPSYTLKKDIDLSHPSSSDLSGALGQYESIRRVKDLSTGAIKVEKASGSTQRAITTGSYVKVANMAKELGAKSVLDYGAGFGLGSDAMAEIIPNVESFEPNYENWKGKNKPTFTNNTDINKKYDAVVSLNVLNVVPKETRDAIIKDIYNKLNTNGSAIISTRGWTGDIKEGSGRLGEENNSRYILSKQDGKNVERYQKGFDGNELVDYVKEILGDNVTVKKDNSFGKAGVIITKTGEYEYALKQKANAQYRIESGKNIIEALREFNKAKDKGKAVVAITHEIMHPTVVEIISGAKEGNEIGKKHTETIVNEFNKATNSNITVDELISGNDDFKGGKTTKQYRDVQEFIAESWEKYHTQGAKGFSAEFQKVLKTITEAFKSVYNSLTGKELTPELKRMFDDILGKSDFKSEYEKQISSEGISKKRQENARKTIIDSNFDEIVKDLIRNNKIQKIC